MMYDRKLPESARTARDDHSPPMPGRSTRVQQAYGASAAAFPSPAAAAAAPATTSPLFDGDAQWEEISPDEGERMVDSIEPAPGDAASEAADETVDEAPGE